MGVVPRREAAYIQFRMRPSWFKISAILASVWLVVGGLLWGLHEWRPSPEKLLEFALSHRVAGKSEAERTHAIDAVAAEYFRLDGVDRGKLLASGELAPWWTELTKPERLHFRMLLFPKTLLMADFFDKFSPEQRMTNVQKLMRDVRKRGGEDIPDVSPQMLALVKNLGLKMFIMSPMLDERIDSLLMFYELERRLVWTRR
jgi:hypothetical protein